MNGFSGNTTVVQVGNPGFGYSCRKEIAGCLYGSTQLHTEAVHE